MGNLASEYGKQAVSVRKLAEAEDVSYQFACKILQQLHEAGLVESKMGPKGGYKLACEPGGISLLDIVQAMQDDVVVNRCTHAGQCCSRQSECPVSPRLWQLQDMVNEYLKSASLQTILDDINKNRVNKNSVTEKVKG